MTAKIFTFDDYAPNPHLSGEARCLTCGHTWVAIAPSGTVWLECPECKTEKGRFCGPVEESGEHWTCNCGCDLFHISRKGIYCPNCGVRQNFDYNGD